MRGRRVVSYSCIFIMLAFLLSINLIYAGKSDDLNNINSQIKEKKQELNEGKKKEKELASQVNTLQAQINTTQKEIASIQANINKTEQDIAAAKVELDKVQAAMTQQNDNLDKRLRAMYKNGDIGFLEIILGSEDITDFMTNMDMVQKIFNNDMEVLKQIEEQHRKIEAQKKNLENLEAQLVASKNQQAEKQASLKADKDKVAAMKDEVAQDNAENEKQLQRMAAEADRLTSEIQALQRQNTTVNTQYTQYLGNGKLGWPVSGRITSEFVNRISPITGRPEKHLGLDIAVPTGTPVAAAEAGTVIKAGWNNSYGYMVIVDHGGGIATLYAHNSRLAVSAGQSVTRGQTVAYAGSTGDSTGPHCHFEVRVNGQYENPRKWL